MTNNDSTSENKVGLLRVITDHPPRAFVIGDIHGCLNELNCLLVHLLNNETLVPEDLIIFIGDYIDRGPSSKGVLDRLIQFKTEHPNTIFLKGNHEDMLLSYLGFEGRGGEVYLHNGGLEFFRNYKAPAFGEKENLRAALPNEHVEFLKSLEWGLILAEFVIVHAGLNPAKKLEDQSSDDLLWIRSEFTNHPHTFNKTVVFGHTPFEEIYLNLPFMIGIDTGLVYGNKLTCFELVNGRVLQVEYDEQVVKTTSLSPRLADKTS